MKQPRRRLVLVLCILLVGGALAVILEPSGRGRAFLAGEPFHRFQPLRHWREILRQQGEQGSVSRDVRGRFWDFETGFPVLRACARDPDRKVRWPAIYLIGFFGRGNQAALTVLIEALEDEDTEVRLQACGGLGSWGVMARRAIPALEAARHDRELQVAYSADLALWEIDVPSAVVSCGWKPYRSAEWQFSVMLPGAPELSQKEVALPPVMSHRFEAGHRLGNEENATRYSVAVCEYPEEAVRASTEKERLDSSRDFAVVGVNGKLVKEREIELSGRKGREQIIEVPDMGGILRARNFWSGRRLYIVQVVSKPAFLNAKAADHFLDSFRFEPEKAPVAEKP
jgi:hypothetical protein